MKFLSLTSEFGIKAARAYFRQFVDETRLNRTLQLKDILKHTFKSEDFSLFDRYDGLVEAIDSTEFSSCNEEPLGGKSGDVFRAEWSCPQKIDMSSPKSFSVALKRIWPPSSDSAGSRSENRLFRELDLTLQVSARRPSGLGVLFGLTRFPSDHILSKRSDWQTEDLQESIFLVFEFARQSLKHYLNTLEGVDRGWDTIAYRFEDLADSMRTIHEQNIVHRDIHLENIMIREETYSRSPTILSSDQLVIIDFGESRTLETVSESYNIYGDDDYRAPEVKSGSDMSMKSDMYAIGRIMIKILELGHENIGKNRLVPKPLLDVAEVCLQKDPNRRATAQELSLILNRTNSDHYKLLESGLGFVDFNEEEFIELPEANSWILPESDSEEDYDSLYG